MRGLSFALVLAAASLVTGCSMTTTANTSRSDSPADIIVNQCKQDPADNTQVIASGWIRSNSSVPLDYSFVIDWASGAGPAAQNSVMKGPVNTEATVGWSSSASVAGVVTPPVTCRIRSVVRAPASSVAS